MLILTLEIIGGIILFLICLRFGLIQLFLDVLFAVLSSGNSDSKSSGSGFRKGGSGGGGSSNDY